MTWTNSITFPTFSAIGEIRRCWSGGILTAKKDAAAKPSASSGGKSQKKKAKRATRPQPRTQGTNVITLAYITPYLPTGAQQKWSAKKVKDKANNLVVLDKPTYDRLFKEVPSYKLVTPSVLVDRLRLNGSLARIAIRELEAKGLIRKITSHSSQMIYTRATGYVEAAAADEPGEKAAKAPKASKAKKSKAAAAEEEAPAEEE
ncbi:S25 ribosomal protein-domain-containing protein [Jimgerdemannia flammicorona]|uniref:S25 ribosomal protein-domain-containing protein n=1 Tax=Jimgerdemannia flammicorona TaxID=994334 RepID=A0A433Q7G0_9FUNG|nr:S25 ribosomal protein-domain-containing protein [Jimgerdemannia flammicorona]